MNIETFILKVRRDNFLAVCPNKVKGATTVNVTWNYSESAGSAVAAALEAEVSIVNISCCITENIVKKTKISKAQSKHCHLNL